MQSQAALQLEARPGVLSDGDGMPGLLDVEGKVVYDEGDSFVHSMGINRVPVKVFLEDGIIKKGWIGAAMTEQTKRSFVEWFDSLN